jgi:hypothetical protein
VNFFVVWRAKAQRRKEKTPLRLRVFARVNFFLAKQERRKEIKEALSDLPAVGRLGLNLFFGAQSRRDAKKKRNRDFEN